MIRGQFNTRGELIFEIELIATDSDDEIPVNVLLDTGFTGWLAIDNQDAESLGWLPKIDQKPMQTARGDALFNLYEGQLRIDGEEFTIEVLGGDDLPDILLGVYWLQMKRLVVDFAEGILTLGSD